MPLLPSQPVPVLRSIACSLITYPDLTPLDPGVPVCISWPTSYLKLLQRGRGFLSFWRKEEAKRFLRSSSPILRTYLLCPRWRIEEISILVGLHVPLCRNYPGYISPWFCWSCCYSSLTSAYALSTNLVWTRSPWCNLPDNVPLCTP